MKYYSTNNHSAPASLYEAVVRGLAPDRGLYMPERIKRLPDDFFRNIHKLSFKEIAFEVAKAFFGEDVAERDLQGIVYGTLSFDCPLVHVGGNVWALELFHGPTFAFKDVGARFMARMLSYLIRSGDVGAKGRINVLVATSGDTGSAVANGFFRVDGVHVYVLYPKGKVSLIQESQFATLGGNITALELDGTFDDCQALVKEAFADRELNERLTLTSANSINVARFLPQAFYYFYAYARMQASGLADNLVACVPCGNLGNVTAGLFAQRMGLPLKRFIAANNANDVFSQYLRTGVYSPKHSVQTIANAMDVGAPSNFARILELYGNSHAEVCRHVSGVSFTDADITKAMADCYGRHGYVLDPHGACGWKALDSGLQQGETGFFLETAHPAKFAGIVERAIGAKVDMPMRLTAFLKRRKLSLTMPNDYCRFRDFLANSAG